jgi:hypothetical protein
MECGALGTPDRPEPGVGVQLCVGSNEGTLPMGKGTSLLYV